MKRRPRKKLAALNVPVVLEDGQTLLAKSGSGSTLVARQSETPGLQPGDEVRSVLQTGKVAILQVQRCTGKGGRDVHLRILRTEVPDE